MYIYVYKIYLDITVRKSYRGYSRLFSGCGLWCGVSWYSHGAGSKRVLPVLALKNVTCPPHSGMLKLLLQKICHKDMHNLDGVSEGHSSSY